jgi:hypothetical protein
LDGCAREFSVQSEGKPQSSLCQATLRKPGCPENVLELTDGSVLVEEYRDRSVRAVTDSWCEYQAQGRDFAPSTYIKPRIYYVDNDLVVAITGATRAFFVTYFHEHFDGRRPLHGNHPGRGVSVAQRRICYREDLRVKEQGRVIINVKVVRDG